MNSAVPEYFPTVAPIQLQRLDLAADAAALLFQWNDYYPMHVIAFRSKQTGGGGPDPTILATLLDANSAPFSLAGAYQTSLKTCDPTAATGTFTPTITVSTEPYGVLSKGSGTYVVGNFTIIQNPAISATTAYVQGESHQRGQFAFTRSASDITVDMTTVPEADRKVGGLLLTLLDGAATFAAGTVVEVYGSWAMSTTLT